MNSTTRASLSLRTPAQMRGKATVSLLWVVVIKAIGLRRSFRKHIIEHRGDSEFFVDAGQRRDLDFAIAARPLAHEQRQ